MKTILDTNKLAKLVSDNIASFIPSPNANHKNLYEAQIYAVSGNGKRLRPVILLSVAQKYGVDVKKAVPYAIALEFIHSYSLVHDDLPAMDNDELRRGLPTVHKKFGENIAILAGDALLTLAFSIISKDKNFDDETKTKCTNILADSAYAMVEGQIDDILFNEPVLCDSKNTIQNIFLNKTAALFIAAFTMGGLLGNAKPEDIKLLRDFGENFGIAFQIADDIDDYSNKEDVNICNEIGIDAAKEILNTKIEYLKQINSKLNIENLNEIISFL